MKRHLPLAAVLLVGWFALWGDVSVANLLGGALVIGILLFLLPQPPSPWRHRLSAVAVARLAGVLVVSLVTSSARVAMTVIRPTPERLRSGTVEIPLRTSSPLCISTIGNLISLTPGTLTLAATAEPAQLEVHVLGLTDPEEFRASVFRLEDLVVAALRPSPRPGETATAGPGATEATP